LFHLFLKVFSLWYVKFDVFDKNNNCNCSCCCGIFSSRLPTVPRDASTVKNVYAAPQLGSSSSSATQLQPFAARGSSHAPNQPSFPTQRFPQPSSSNQQRPQVRQQGFTPPWLQAPRSTASRQQLWPPPSWPAACTNYQSDSAVAAKTAAHGGRGGDQQVTVRPPQLPVRPPQRPIRPPPTVSSRSAEKTHEIRKKLLEVFPDNAKQIETVLQQNRFVTSVDTLCDKVFEIV